MSLAEAADNPIAVIGHNSGAVDGEAPPYTIEELRIVMRAIEYLQRNVEGLDDILVKRKGGRILGWLQLLAWILKGRVRLSVLHLILNRNRKTMGENQKRPEVWASLDDETSHLFSIVRDAVLADGYFTQEVASRVTELVKEWVKLDPPLREGEELERAKARAKAEAESLSAEREAHILEVALRRNYRMLRDNLRGVSNKTAILNKHSGGAKYLAAKISKNEEALKVLITVAKAERKGARRKSSELDDPIKGDYGLRVCLREDLVAEVHPWDPANKKSADPAIMLTQLGQQTYAAVLEKVGTAKRAKRSR